MVLSATCAADILTQVEAQVVAFCETFDTKAVCPQNSLRQEQEAQMLFEAKHEGRPFERPRKCSLVVDAKE
jgi:hypothetical protein